MPLRQVDTLGLRDDSHMFGPYRVEKAVVRANRAVRRWRMREEDSRSRSLFQVTGPDGGRSLCSVPLAWPFPNEIRLGCTAELDGAPVRISKRWLHPVMIHGPNDSFMIERVGIIGFRMRSLGQGAVVAEQRRGTLQVASDLEPSVAALVVAAVEVPLTEAVCPVAWVRGF
jgi:hypothetical protein